MKLRNHSTLAVSVTPLHHHGVKPFTVDPEAETPELPDEFAAELLRDFPDRWSPNSPPAGEKE